MKVAQLLLCCHLLTIPGSCGTLPGLGVTSPLDSELQVEIRRLQLTITELRARADKTLRLRGGSWKSRSGRGQHKRSYEELPENHSDQDIPTFFFANPSEDHPQIPFAPKEGKLEEFEFPEGYRDEDDEDQLADARAARAERRNRVKEREADSDAESAQANPVLSDNEPDADDDSETLKTKFLNTLDPEQRELCVKFFEYQLKHNPGWDWQTTDWEQLENFYNRTSEETRTDDFPLLQRDQAEAYEQEFADMEAKYPYLPDLLTSAPMPRLITWWQSCVAQYGMMWDVVARGRGITIKTIHAASCSNKGPKPYTLWTTQGHWRYKCHSKQMWTQVGGATLQLPHEEGYYAPIQLWGDGVHVRAGSTQAFYLHTAEDEDGVALRTWPCEAVDDGEHCAINGTAYDEKHDTWSVDGTKYSFEDAQAGAVVDRNADLLVLRGVVSPAPTPFANVSEHAVPVAWCGMIDYQRDPR